MVIQVALPGPLVVGLDPSELSFAAVEWAAPEAASMGVPLRIVCPEEGVLAEAGRRAHYAAPGLDVTTTRVTGDLVEVLVSVSADSALVVVTSVLAGMAPLRPRSVGERVAALGHCPLVTVPAESYGEPGDRRPVVVGVDGDPSERAVEFAFHAAALRQADVVAVHALPPELAWQGAVAGPGTDDRSADQQWARDRGLAIAHWAAKFPEVHSQVEVLMGHPVSVLLRKAKDASLLVVGTTSQVQVAQPRIGCVTEAVLRHATCPVAVVHAS